MIGRHDMWTTKNENREHAGKRDLRCEVIFTDMVEEACKSIKYGIITVGKAKAHLREMLIL